MSCSKRWPPKRSGCFAGPQSTAATRPLGCSTCWQLLSTANGAGDGATTALDGALADGTSGSAAPMNGGSAAAATVEANRAAPKINDEVSSQGPFHRADLEEPFLIKTTETIVCYIRVESTSRQNIATQLQIFPEVSLCEKPLEPLHASCASGFIPVWT